MIKVNKCLQFICLPCIIFNYYLVTFLKLSLIIINMFLFFLGITMTVGFYNDIVPMEIAG